MLAWRQENTDRKAGRPDDGWQVNPTLGLLQSLRKRAWRALAGAWMTMPDFTRLIGIDSPRVPPFFLRPTAGSVNCNLRLPAGAIGASAFGYVLVLTAFEVAHGPQPVRRPPPAGSRKL